MKRTLGSHLEQGPTDSGTFYLGQKQILASGRRRSAAGRKNWLFFFTTSFIIKTYRNFLFRIIYSFYKFFDPKILLNSSFLRETFYKDFKGLLCGHLSLMTLSLVQIY